MDDPPSSEHREPQTSPSGGGAPQGQSGLDARLVASSEEPPQTLRASSPEEGALPAGCSDGTPSIPSGQLPLRGGAKSSAGLSEDGGACPISGAADLRSKDSEALTRYPGVRSAHTYQASWYNNATFVFPLIAVIIAAIVWLVTGSAEAGGAAIFFLVVTGAMLPVVFITWQRQTTAVIVHDDGVTALHVGLEQQTIAWDELRSVRRVETMGNVRWYLDGSGEEHIVIEGEIAEREELLTAARAEFERRGE